MSEGEGKRKKGGRKRPPELGRSGKEPNFYLTLALFSSFTVYLFVNLSCVPCWRLPLLLLFVNSASVM